MFKLHQGYHREVLHTGFPSPVSNKDLQVIFTDRSGYIIEPQQIFPYNKLAKYIFAKSAFTAWGVEIYTTLKFALPSTLTHQAYHLDMTKRSQVDQCDEVLR